MATFLFSISMACFDNTVSLMLQGDHGPVAYRNIELTHTEFEWDVVC